MRVGFITLVFFAFAATSSAQLTPEEAYQKLREKQKAAAAASQPADATGSVAAPASTSGKSGGSGVLLGLMIHKGWEAASAKRYAEAIALFTKAIEADKHDPNALQGRGICEYELKQYKAADADLELALNLSGGDPAHASRQLVIAAAAASVENDNPMRAAKMLQTVMEFLDQNGTLNEELQNDLGVSLSHVNAQARKLPRFTDALKYYMEYDAKLNRQKNDSTNRWGTTWIDRAEAERKWKEYKEGADAVTTATSDYQHAVLARKNAYENYLEIVGGLRLHGTLEAQQRTEEYKQSVRNEAAAQRQANDAVARMKSVEKPPFPDHIEHDWHEPQ